MTPESGGSAFFATGTKTASTDAYSEEPACNESPEPAMVKFLVSHALRKDLSILDLGCGAGNTIRLLAKELIIMGGHGVLTGVDVVPGWIEAGNAALQQRYDLVMLNDVMEHVMPARYPCLFRNIRRHTKPGALAYFHLPAPETQIGEREIEQRTEQQKTERSTMYGRVKEAKPSHQQFFENVVPISSPTAQC